MKIDLIEPLEYQQNNIFVLRDDLYPFLGGGNKGRKIATIAEDIKSKGSTAIVTTGGINSNHCRVTAVYAAQHNMQCTLVLHGCKETFFKQQGNSQIMRDTNAKLIFVDEPTEISSAMDSAMQSYFSAGGNPYYLWGGGHSLVGAKAYIDAVEELADFREKTHWSPKYIFLASGTGSTQAGIMAGLDKYDFNDTTVIGISIARTKQNAEAIISKFYKELCLKYNITPRQKTIVIDDYLFGGYENFNSGIAELSRNSLKNYGFILDTTYTGKAFYGMQNYLNSMDEDVLFWHTGGLLNYLK